MQESTFIKLRSQKKVKRHSPFYQKSMIGRENIIIIEQKVIYFPKFQPITT